MASYSEAGKFNWVRTVSSNSSFGALVASNDGLFFSCKIYGEANTAFDLLVDTTDHKSTVLSFIRKNGEIAWNRSTVAKSVEGLALTLEGDAVVYGELDYRTGYFHRPDEREMPKVNLDEDIYVATFDKIGNYKSLVKTNILISTGNSRMFVVLDKADRIYVGGLIWCGQHLEMNWINEAFKGGVCYGGVPFVGRMKKMK